MRARQVEAESEEPVVRADEVVAARGDRDRTPGAADAGIDDGQVHGAAREPPPRGLEQERAAADVLRGHRVGEVDEPRPRVDAEQHALDDPDVPVVEAEIGEQGDHAARARPPPPGHRSRWIT
jgi:hypothetical protein